MGNTPSAVLRHHNDDWDDGTIHTFDSRKLHKRNDEQSMAWTAGTISTKDQNDDFTSDGSNATEQPTGRRVKVDLTKYKYRLKREEYMDETSEIYRSPKKGLGSVPKPTGGKQKSGKSKPSLLISTYPSTLSPSTVDLEKLPLGGFASNDEFSHVHVENAVRSYDDQGADVDCQREAKERHDEGGVFLTSLEDNVEENRDDIETHPPKVSEPKKKEKEGYTNQRGNSPEPNRYRQTTSSWIADSDTTTLVDSTVVDFESTESQEGFEITQNFKNLAKSMTSFFSGRDFAGSNPLERLSEAVETLSPKCENSSPDKSRGVRARRKLSQEEIQFDFVERYQDTFLAFLRQYPHLGMNERMLDIMKIAKLAKIMDTCQDHEENLRQEIDRLKESKPDIIKGFRLDLVEASRKRAAREVSLQQELDIIENETKDIQRKLTWKALESYARVSSKEAKLVSRLKNETHSPVSLYSEIPDITEASKIREAMDFYPDACSTQEQDRELLELQEENSSLRCEIEVLEKKLVNQYVRSKKAGWVDNVLSKMNEQHMDQLKQRYDASAPISK